MEKSFCHDLYCRIMIRPHGAVLPTGMGMVEIPTELSKAVCLLVKNYTVKGGYIMLNTDVLNDVMFQRGKVLEYE